MGKRRWYTSRRRLIGMALLIAALTLFGWYAYARLTTMPPLTYAEYRAWLHLMPERTPDDVSDEVLAAMKVLLSPADFDATPPPGERWDWGDSSPPNHVNVGHVICGPWDPRNRPVLRAAVAFLDSEPCVEAFELLRECGGKPFVLDPSRPDDLERVALRGFCVGRLRDVMVARARFLHAEIGDNRAAWEQLELALWLCRPRQLPGSINLLVALYDEHDVLRELTHLCREQDLDADLIADIRRKIQALPSLDDEWSVQARARHEERIALINCLYTDDGHGNGWAVLAPEGGLGDLLYKLPPKRNRYWNLASGLYDDRATVVRTASRLFEAELGITDLSHAECLRRYGSFQQAPAFGALCHPTLTRSGESLGQCLGFKRWLSDKSTERRAILVMLALNGYRRDHGEYPDSLADLIPEYLDELPIDPYSGKPLCYRAEQRDCLLYSAGSNGIDDDGAERRTTDGGYDLVFTGPRNNYHDEPEVLPAEETPE